VLANTNARYYSLVIAFCLLPKRCLDTKKTTNYCCLRIRRFSYTRHLFERYNVFRAYTYFIVLTNCNAYSVSQKSPPPVFLTLFPNGSECLLQILRAYYVPTYIGLQICIQCSATLTKLCHIKRDHHHMLKMTTIGRTHAGW